MKLNAFAAVALLGGLVFASSVYSQPAQTGGPTPSPPGAKEEFVDLNPVVVYVGLSPPRQVRHHRPFHQRHAE